MALIHPATPAPGPVVLVVDDESDIRLTYRLMLEGAGYRVVDAPQARAAMVRLQEHKVAVALIDLRLTGPMDGIALITTIRHRPKPRPVMIAMSGSADLPPKSSLKAARAAGADAILTKPITRDGLLATIRSLLEGMARPA